MNIQVNTEPEKQRFLGIEIFRVIGATLVLDHHYKNFVTTINPTDVLVQNGPPLNGLVNIDYDYFKIIISIFWCVSGFIFYYKYHSLIYKKPITSFDFLITRASRLYPLHIATLLLSLIAQVYYKNIYGNYFYNGIIDFYHLFLQLFMASSWGLENDLSFNLPIWSISVEVLVYIIFFILSLYLKKSFLNLCIIISAIFLLQLYKSNQFLGCLNFFYVGAISSYAYERFSNSIYKNRMIIISFTLLISSFISVFYFKDKFNLDHNFFSIFAIFYSPLILFITANFEFIFKNYPNLSRAIETGGKITFESYLLHFPLLIIALIFFKSVNFDYPSFSWIALLLYLTGIYSISYFTYRYFSKPMEKWIRKKYLTAP